VKLAQAELDRNREHAEALLQKAKRALETVRRLAFNPPLLPESDRLQLSARCDELESAIRLVSPE
jgi:hypothetical protein